MTAAEPAANGHVDPERMLALAYVPTRARAAVATLWALDARLGAVLATTHEPTVGMLRLTWWRDALSRLDGAPAPAEPLLLRVAETLLPFVSGSALAALAEGWGAILQDEAGEVDGWGERGATLFVLAAQMLGHESDTVRTIGAGWGFADLAHGTPDLATRSVALTRAKDVLADWDGRVSRHLRPLGMLAMLARSDAACSADALPRQGAPARVARMLRYRLFGQ